jgi:hypothetical protein
LQRSRETLEGLLARTKRESLLALHRNAQRLLQPLAVVNPYADQLSFRDDQTRSRRDHVKYLTLIRSIALLHQFQRDIRIHEGLRYIEVIPSDIELANELAQEVFSRTVDELLPQTRKLLVLLHGWVKAACEMQDIPQHEFHFTRRQVREALGWGDTQLRIHLDRLMEMEFLVAHRGRKGQSYEYELLYQGEDANGNARLLGLLDCEKLRGMVMTPTSRGCEDASRVRNDNLAAPSRGDRGGCAGGFRGSVDGLKHASDMDLSPFDVLDDSKRGTPVPISLPSYLPPLAAAGH